MEQEPARTRAIVTFEGRITRCGCGNPPSHPGVVCPTPLRVEDKGVLASGEVTL